MREIKINEDRHLYCIDWTEDLYILGNEQAPDYQRIEFIVTPCNYIHQTFGYEDTVNENCVRDLKEQ